MGKNKLNLKTLGLAPIDEKAAAKVNGGFVHMSAARYHELQDLLAIHNSIVALRQARRQATADGL